MVHIVVTFNRPEYLTLCVESLLVTIPEGDKVCIVNNCSTDNTVNLIRSFKAQFPGRVFIHDAETNLGCARGRNRGFDLFNTWDTEDLISFTDDDYLFRLGWVERSIEMFSLLKDVAFVSCHSDQKRDNVIREGDGFQVKDVMTSSQCVIEKKVFRKIGGYKETKNIMGWVSQDFCKRLLAIGRNPVRIATVPALVANMDHKHHPNNLAKLYEATGYNRHRRDAKSGKIELGDNVTGQYFQNSRTVDLRRRG